MFDVQIDTWFFIFVVFVVTCIDGWLFVTMCTYFITLIQFSNKLLVVVKKKKNKKAGNRFGVVNCILCGDLTWNINCINFGTYTCKCLQPTSRLLVFHLSDAYFHYIRVPLTFGISVQNMIKMFYLTVHFAFRTNNWLRVCDINPWALYIKLFWDN